MAESGSIIGVSVLCRPASGSPLVGPIAQPGVVVDPEEDVGVVVGDFGGPPWGEVVAVEVRGRVVLRLLHTLRIPLAAGEEIEA
jgi:hypothetical protein